MSASFRLLRQRTVELLTLVASEPRGIGVLEEESHGIADEHFVPDADAHGRAFFGVHGLAAEILLVDAHVEDIEAAEPADDGRLQAQLEQEKVQAGLINDRDHFAEQHVDVAGALLDDGVEAEETQQPKRLLARRTKQADEG